MNRLLQDWVRSQAERNPERVAVAFKGESATYGELEAFSNQLARILREGGCSRLDRVCMLVPKSVQAIVSLLGIYKADCIFVPLDPLSPAPRLMKIIQSSQPRWILAVGAVTRLLDEILDDDRLPGVIRVGCMDSERGKGENFKADFSWSDLSTYPDNPLESQNQSHDPAHILFTSGSTGIPKGVMVTHSSVVHFMEWAKKYFRLDSSDRISCHSPLHFDLSTFDLFGAFAAGARVHLVPPELNLLANKLVEFIGTEELTQWFSVPSILSYMAQFGAVRFKDFPALKRLLWCGEVFPTPALVHWMKRLPHVTFTNLYGPTEATIASSYYTVPECPEDLTAAIPIGTACDGEELLVLDEKLQRIPPGQVGDLYIRGVGLSPGYWRDPEKTREVFLPAPGASDPKDRIYKTGDLARIEEDGLVYFVGRADSQIKSRGYRIELGEIETGLNTLPGLRECAVVAISGNGFEGHLICCAYVPSPLGDPGPAVIRRELSKLLPSYMLPSRWMALNRFPVNANGKIDRRKLKEEFENKENAPQTA